VTVSEIPGTTRDAIDTLVLRQGRRYRFVDTAGLRRRGKTEDSPMCSRRPWHGGDRAVDCVILVLDASTPLTALDQTIAGYASEAHRPVILAGNKWDLVEEPERATKELRDEMGRRFQFLRFAPVLTLSALTD